MQGMGLPAALAFERFEQGLHPLPSDVLVGGEAQDLEGRRGIEALAELLEVVVVEPGVAKPEFLQLGSARHEFVAEPFAYRW